MPKCETPNCPGTPHWRPQWGMLFCDGCRNRKLRPKREKLRKEEQDAK